MKIVQSTKAYYPHLGGVETTVKHLAEGFAKRGHTSNVIACNDFFTDYSQQINDVDINYTATISRVSSFPLSPAYPCRLMRSSADILAIHEPFLLGSMSYLAFLRQAKKKFKRLVIWWHSDIIKQQVFARLYEPILTNILHECDAVVAATPHNITSSKLLSQFKSKCTVIHHGIDIDRLLNGDRLEAKIAGIKAKYCKPIVLFSGRLVYYKGIEYLVAAMQSVPDAHLVVVGKGVLLEKIQTIAQTGLNNISFIPYLSDEDLQAMYHACSIFVLPSIANSEAYGLVQLEAMACGKPVITCDLPTGVTYINRDRVTGLVVPIKDPGALAEAISTLIADPHLAYQLGQTAQKRVAQEFGIDRMVEQTIDLYQHLLGTEN
jgi:glycosyltransferase involved in cell wall biosynthesis